MQSIASSGVSTVPSSTIRGASEQCSTEANGRRYYEPSEQGSEAAIAERLQRWWGGDNGQAQ